MPIETDIKSIKRSHAKNAKTLRGILQWEVSHEKDNNTRFDQMAEMFQKLPTEESISLAIEKSVKTTVNGKIDAVKTQLDKQDIVMAELNRKVKPIDGARAWLTETGRIVLYLGGLALAVTGIIEALKIFHIIP